MKNLTLLGIVFALLCCGLVKINLVAQNTEPGVSASGVSVDQDYIDLLKKRVEVARIKFEEIDAAYNAGAQGGTALRQAESRIALATAEAGLYRQTGERENLLAALERKRKAAEFAVDAAKAGRQAGTIPNSLFLDAELALAEAEYELKQAQQGAGDGAQQGAGDGAQQRAGDGAQRSPRIPPLLFQGKTFKQWVELLETELDPKIRAEAFRALTLFGANGRGKEATEVIIDVAKEVNFATLSGSDNPVEKMKHAAIDAFSAGNVRIPIEDSLPILIEKYTSGSNNENEHLLIKSVLWRIPEYFDKEQFSFCYDKLMQWDISNLTDTRPMTLLTVLSKAKDGEMTLKFLRETIKNGDANRFQLVFSNFVPPEMAENKLYIDRGPSFGFVPQVVERESSRTIGGSGRSWIENPRLTPFGQSMLTLLQDEGLKSDDASIRETSQKVVDVLKSIEGMPQ